MSNKLSHPTVIGILLVGITFNIMMIILGLLGFRLLDALYLTVILLTIIGSLTVQMLLRHSRKTGD